MAQGIVKWFREKTGYGFIEESDSGSNIFVHHSEIKGSPLRAGELVEFEIETRSTGPIATSVFSVWTTISASA